MITLEEVDNRLKELELKVEKLSNDAKGQDRLNARVFEILSEVRDDVALLRKHSASMGRKIEDMDARITTMDARLSKLDTNFSAFQRSLPSMMAETMREVLREQRS